MSRNDKNKESEFLELPTLGVSPESLDGGSFSSREQEMIALLEFSSFLFQTPWMKKKLEARWDRVRSVNFEPFSLL